MLIPSVRRGKRLLGFVAAFSLAFAAAAQSRNAPANPASEQSEIGRVRPGGPGQASFRVLLLSAPRQDAAAPARGAGARAAMMRLLNDAQFVEGIRAGLAEHGSPLLAVAYGESGMTARALLESTRRTAEFGPLVGQLFPGSRRIQDPSGLLIVMMLDENAPKSPDLRRVLESIQQALKEKHDQQARRPQGLVPLATVLPTLPSSPVVVAGPDTANGILFNCQAYQGTYWSGQICDCLGSGCGCSGWGWGVCAINGAPLCGCVLP